MGIRIQPKELEIPADDPFKNDLLDRIEPVEILTAIIGSIEDLRRTGNGPPFVSESRIKWLLLTVMLATSIAGSVMGCVSPPDAAPVTPTLESHSSVPPAPRPESSPISEEATLPASLQAQYAISQLRKWYEQMGQDTDIYSLPELTLTDLDEGKNRIEVGVACESDRDRVREELQKQLTPLGIPLEAITITVRGRAYPLITPPVFECIPPETVDPVTGLSTPGFGGLYFDSGIAYVYLLEPSRAVAEELVLNQIGRESFERLHEVRAQKGQYTWTQLTEWYELISGDVREIPATDVVSIDRHTNRLTIEVRKEQEGSAESKIRDILSRHGVPYDAVILLT